MKRKILKRIWFVFLPPVFWMIFLIIRNSLNTSINDSDLAVAFEEVPAESNAFGTLLKATNELYWPDKQWKRLDDLSNNTNWNNALAADVLEKNQSCLKLFNEAMQQSFLQVPEPSNFDYDYSYFDGWRNISRLESIQTVFLHRAKKDKEAFDSAFEIINFGQRIENSGGTTIHYLSGSGVKSLGLFRIQQMIADTTLNESDLTSYIHRLDKFRANGEGFTNSLKVEYQIQRNLIDNIAKGKFPGETNSGSEQMGYSIGLKLMFSPRKTKMEFVQADRFVLEHFSTPYGDIPWSNLPGSETNISVFKSLAGGNAIGDIFLEMLDLDPKLIATWKARDNVNVTATQLLLALKIYKMKHGSLPKSLSELVPDYFPQVPVDDFDGKPFRYLPDKKIIYSIGPCLKDLGGKGRERNSDDYNLPFKIEF